MLELGGAVVSVLDRSGRDDVRLHQPCYSDASTFGLVLKVSVRFS